MQSEHAATTVSDRGPYSIPSTSTLLAFESAARHGNFSQAARELETSQSAISRLMARLETQLGARLFERSRTGVRLTEAGR
ncbi:MAG: LysR family transcriptional regulator [Bryobacterales bacterium]|nr:LysR family transcriptional regulator [Bryobacterales bacterium]